MTHQTHGTTAECVNGSRGNAADHLTKDVVPYVISNFGVSAAPKNWALLGWSTGGTCALTLSVTHPELFSTFVDLDGQLGPNAGNKEQTIASRAMIDDYIKKTNTQLWIEHDFAGNAKLRKSPQYYE